MEGRSGVFREHPYRSLMTRIQGGFPMQQDQQDKAQECIKVGSNGSSLLFGGEL